MALIFRNKFPWHLFALVVAGNFFVTIALAAEFYVAPNGTDTNPGTLQSPFATLSQARDAARSIIQKNPNEDATIWIRGGLYRLTETLVLDERDSRIRDRTTTFAAYHDEKPVFTSGVPINGWHRPISKPDGLPQVAQGKVWVADVPHKLPNGQPWHFRTLYENEVRLFRARSAGFQLQAEKSTTIDPRSTFRFPKGVLHNWSNLSDVELLVRPSFAWIFNILPLASVDEPNRVAVTGRLGTYPLLPNVSNLDQPNCWVENVLEALNGPGQWVFNSIEGKLYLWPTDAMLAAGQGAVPDNRINAPALVELVRVEGKLDAPDGSADVPVRGIVFKNLIFTGGDRYLWSINDLGFQHEWAAVDQANALLRLRGAENCVVEGCTFEQSGACGVRLDLFCQHNRIEGNDLQHLGEHGIALCGYGPGTKDVNQSNQVLNNWIHHCGEIIWNAVGIYIAQSGSNHIAFNRINDLPYTGIVLSGVRDFTPYGGNPAEGSRSVRWQDFSPDTIDHWKQSLASGISPWQEFFPYLHARNNLIEGNDLSACVQVLGDGNGIYLSGAGEGNVIERNFIHDLLGEGDQSAMRPDDQQRGTTFRDNIIWNCVFAAVEHKHQNVYENNIFACIHPKTPGGREWKESAYFLLGRGPSDGTIMKRNVFYSIQDSPVFYYERAGVKLEACKPDYDLFFCADNPEWSRQFLQGLQKRGIEQHSLAVDPLFVAPQKGDFRLKANSPLFKIGFHPIAMQHIGIQSPWKKRLNLTEEENAGEK